MPTAERPDRRVNDRIQDIRGRSANWRRSLPSGALRLEANRVWLKQPERNDDAGRQLEESRSPCLDQVVQPAVAPERCDRETNVAGIHGNSGDTRSGSGANGPRLAR